jgi:hypothetical protein
MRYLVQQFKKILSARSQKVFYSKKYLIYTRSSSGVGRFFLAKEFNLAVISSCKEYYALLEKGCDFSSYPRHEIIEDALNSGACLILIFREKTLAHSTWVAFEYCQAKYDSLFVTGRIGLEGDAFIGPCNTYLPFRGQGLYPAALEIACDFSKRRGLSRVIINTKEKNLASKSGIERAGFKITGTVRVVYLLGMKLHFRVWQNQNKSMC